MKVALTQPAWQTKPADVIRRRRRLPLPTWTSADVHPSCTHPHLPRPRRPVVRLADTPSEGSPMRSRPTRLTLAATAAALAVSALAAPALTSTATAENCGEGRPSPRRSASRPSTPRSTATPPASWSATCRRPTTRRPRRSPRPSSARPRPAPHQRVRLRRGRPRRRAVPRQLPRGGPERRRAGRLPLLLRRPVQHRRPERLRPRQQRRRRRRRRRVRLRRSTPASTAWWSTRSTRSTPRPCAPSSTCSGRTCRARCCPTTRPRRLRPTGTPPPSSTCSGSRRSRTGTCRSRWPAASPCTSSSPTRRPGLRRPRGPQRHPQPRRDPVLGRLHQRRRAGVVDLRRRGRDRRPGPRPGLRHRRRPERRPARRRLDPRAIQQLLDHPRVQDPHPTARAPSRRASATGGANLTHHGPAAQDTADFAEPRPGNLRADYVLPSARLGDPRLGRLLADVQRPALPRLTGMFPFPTSDHRMVWVDVRLSRR